MKQRGVTLVELVISIVIVAIAITSVLGTMTFASTSSADAMVRQQSVAVASAYLEEALLKPYADPDGVDNEGSNRTAFDDVDDYHGLSDDGARDQFDDALAGLGEYDIDMQVVTETIGGVSALRVDVTVTHSTGLTTVISGYRTSY